MLSQKEWALRWVKKLKQGTYKKTINTLKKGEGHKASYCCLGVGCAITRINTKRGDSYQLFKNKVGLLEEMGLYPQDSLVSLNDTKFYEDKDHKNIYKEMKKVRFSMFIPEVAKYLNQHT